ncbi:DUF484 family protein [Herbaspirillum sp. YR522]|uniref:DUF484 family protein n=1 Tax=Herbaspirillum sp. YR522 TaxID=1144342 RepID=UPI00026FA239|nr:DUF484 family protein [Herbaspirillum sp. YR522]EJN08880.1 hypothetical protein PMI40_01013 [Herbaspirillum sp. YR522]
MTTPLDSGLIAEYLLDHPHFFEEHAELLSTVKLTSPVMGRAVSLQERQMEILREKIKVQELHMSDLMRIAQENDEITSKFQAWTRALLLARNEADLPRVLCERLQEIFHVPQVTLRLWNLAQTGGDAWFTQSVSEDARIFANGLTAPFCGANKEFEAAGWLEDAASVKSVAILPLRGGASTETFGLLVLGSADPGRFTADMGTDFLTRIAETGSAALACLLR